MDTLRLKGLQFFGRHGTEEWEKTIGRRFSVDVELMTDLTRAGLTDHLRNALDYRVVYARAKAVVENQSHNLIERVAWCVMAEMFKAFPVVSEVHVHVSKPEAPIGGLNQAAEVEFSRTREEFERAQEGKNNC
jgi:dihydroneopterin aldolase